MDVTLDTGWVRLDRFTLGMMCCDSFRVDDIPYNVGQNLLGHIEGSFEGMNYFIRSFK